MAKFSDRYGYTVPRNVFIIKDMPEEVVNVLCTALDNFRTILNNENYYRGVQCLTYDMIEEDVWTKFLNRYSRDRYTYNGHVHAVSIPYLRAEHHWYEKLNLLEFIICYLYDYAEFKDSYYSSIIDEFVQQINNEFERLYFGYRIINGEVTPITDNEEITEVSAALDDNTDNVRLHLFKALEQYSRRPEPDYRNSIKESISAVECLCREITGESTLDKAIPKLESSGVQLNAQFAMGLRNLYFYTNDKRTGIRHALMEDTYVPTEADAHYMLIICSAFVNYIRTLVAKR